MPTAREDHGTRAQGEEQNKLSLTPFFQWRSPMDHERQRELYQLATRSAPRGLLGACDAGAVAIGRSLTYNVEVGGPLPQLLKTQRRAAAELGFSLRAHKNAVLPLTVLIRLMQSTSWCSVIRFSMRCAISCISEVVKPYAVARTSIRLPLNLSRPSRFTFVASNPKPRKYILSASSNSRFAS